MKNQIIISLISTFSLIASAEELYGIFSNEAEGFKTYTLMVHENGQACFITSIAGIFGNWSYNKSSSILLFDFFNPEENKNSQIKFEFDSEQRLYKFSKDKSNSSDSLHYITNAFPETVIQAFQKYPEELKNQRKRARISEERRRKLAEEFVAEGYTVDTTPSAPPELESETIDYWTEVFENQKIDSILTAKNKFNNIATKTIRHQLDHDHRHEIKTSLLSDITTIAIEYGNLSICFELAAHPNLDAESFADLYEFSKTFPIGYQQSLTRSLVFNTAIPPEYIQTILNETNGSRLEEIVLIGLVSNISVPNEIILQIQSHAESILNSDAPARDKNTAKTMLNHIKHRKTR
ncbi:hypothetical protein P4C99_21385 [Pontiellaceae bacterium B1224]|nr:hypothetical protein [Pontiellaceae bacterium B1224]